VACPGGTPGPPSSPIAYHPTSLIELPRAKRSANANQKAKRVSFRIARYHPATQATRVHARQGSCPGSARCDAEPRTLSVATRKVATSPAPRSPRHRARRRRRNAMLALEREHLDGGDVRRGRTFALPRPTDRRRPPFRARRALRPKNAGAKDVSTLVACPIRAYNWDSYSKKGPKNHAKTTPDALSTDR
jgi:hypothetical protein